MKKLMLSLLIYLSLSGVTNAKQEYEMSYKEQSNSASLIINQVLKVGAKGEYLFGREFVIDFDSSSAKENGDLSFTINKAKANWLGHGSKFRQQSSHIIGKTFSLKHSPDDEYILSPLDKDFAIEIQLVDSGFPVGRAVSELLPILPKVKIAKGSKWSSLKKIHSLEGWSWLESEATSEHEVTSIEKTNGSVLVHVETLTKGKLKDSKQGRKYIGDGELSRTSSWVFNVTKGHLVSIVSEQNTDGQSDSPHALQNVKQSTSFKLSFGL